LPAILLVLFPFLWVAASKFSRLPSGSAIDAVGVLMELGGVGLYVRSSQWWETRSLARSDRRVQEAREELEAVKAETVPVSMVSAVAVPKADGSTVENAGLHTLEEFNELKGTKIPVELTRIVEGTHKRITVMRGNVSIVVGRTGDVAKILFFTLKKEIYFVDPRRIIKVTSTVKGKVVVTYKLVFDLFFCEALNADGTVEWSDDLEMVLADSTLDQYVTIASFEGGFQFTPTLYRVMLFVAIMGLFLGIGINGSDHVIPITVVHWVP
jgi:hypothetical protein